ncbi:MAG: class I SAM-dependent methyltransferase [Deltaproteobacteria bacterium]|nr:class I SAM-dependent methyltransferase [Deltaproteobacteria bacterium]
MKIHRYLSQLFLVFCLSLMTVACLFAQAPAAKEEYQPSVGQAGKDVIWVPTSQALANKMLSLAQVTPQDYVIDLGSGDGRFVITAAKLGARAHGIEYNPDMVELSKRTAVREGVADKATFIKADLFESDFSTATVITMFLLPDINLRLRPTILNLKPGTRIVSNSFDMGDWNADQTITLGREEGCDNNYCQAYFWVVPAKVAGTWKLPQGELRLKQQYQMISGELSSGKDRVAVTDGRMSGSRISFKIGDSLYTGNVSGAAMEGTYTTGKNSAAWRAMRLAN